MVLLILVAWTQYREDRRLRLAGGICDTGSLRDITDSFWRKESVVCLMVLKADNYGTGDGGGDLTNTGFRLMRIHATIPKARATVAIKMWRAITNEDSTPAPRTKA